MTRPDPDRIDSTVPREQQTLALSASRLDELAAWAVEGTGLAAGARVRDPAGRVALIKNEWTDGWFVPGGAVEPGESPTAAAGREVREETGLEATVGEPLVVVEQTYREAATGRQRFTAAFVVFAARAEGSIPDADRLGVRDDEIRAAGWFETLPELHDAEHIRPYL
ncbi:NUDIX hydrolase [Halobacteriales archaeon QH_10_67_13]|nr:MAG: NUDIX hydrolase [Halobacteriales archaeon QH_10_67_13]